MPAKKAAKTPDTVAPSPSAKKTAAKKSPVASVAKKATKAAAKSTAKTQTTPAAASREQIEKAAYLNYRGRKEKNLPGDAHTDWIEAERSLNVGQ